MAAFLVVGNRRIRLRFFIILALLLEGAFYLFFSNKPAVAYGTISFGKLDVAHKGLAVIIREEKVYTAPAYGEAVYLVADGSEVEAGEPIAVLYKEIYDEDIVKQLYDVQEKIIGYQQEQLMDQVISNDITKINADIDILVSEVQASVKDMEYNELANLESNLRKLLENKQKLLDYQTEPDSYLTELYNKEANLMAQIEEWTMQVESPEAGVYKLFHRWF
ncbi:MAG: HlyD family efflux transporter periplasmic adaptor subunit [Caldicoprobacterales bacterium]